MIVYGLDDISNNVKAGAYLMAQRTTAFAVNSAALAGLFVLAAHAIVVPAFVAIPAAALAVVALATVMRLRLRSQNREIRDHDGKSIPVIKYAMFQIGRPPLVRAKSPVLNGLWDGVEHATMLLWATRPLRMGYNKFFRHSPQPAV